MKQRLFLVLLLIAFVPGFLMGPVAMAQHGNGHGNGGGNGHGNSEGNDQGYDHGNGHGNGRGNSEGQGQGEHGNGHGHGGGRYFRDSDYGMLQQYYSGPRDLPPGLRKKYYRTGTLPPGWQKRFQPMPMVLVQQLPPVPAYCERGYVDGYAVVYDRRTRVIMDAVDMIGALSGR
ncbi:MAG TPA: hypothetical protein VM554_14490 [Acidisarcina sp.]|nr:hypothetical protein [Acidisarcina sp.]